MADSAPADSDLQAFFSMVPSQVPAKLIAHPEPGARVYRVAFKKSPMDVSWTFVDLPFWVVRDFSITVDTVDLRAEQAMFDARAASLVVPG